MELAAVLERLRAIRPQLAERGVCRLLVFGSVARGESHAASDVDLAVDFDRPIGLFAFAGVKRLVEEALQTKVDLVMLAGLRPAMRDSVLKEAVLAA